MILIALGSNLGGREANLAAACGALLAYDITVMATSGIYETPALVPEGAPPEWNIPYLNQVIAVETHHSPEDVLVCLKTIEAELGRTSGPRWAPREIDLDLIAYHDDILVTDALTVPHPQMDQRRFVLAPLCDIAPDWRHPALQKTARQLLAELPA